MARLFSALRAFHRFLGVLDRDRLFVDVYGHGGVCPLKSFLWVCIISNGPAHILLDPLSRTVAFSDVTSETFAFTFILLT